ncbi:MAG: glucuronate isomerase [Phycisphaerae bacterium]
MDLSDVTQQVAGILDDTPTADIHTHLYSEAFGDLLLWGIDELLSYHYLIAELFRYRPDLPYGDFWSMPKARQAELVWDELFVKNTPVSEAARGVVTTLHRLGIDARERNLDKVRQQFACFSTARYIDRVFELANVSYVIMTNDPFDPKERVVWNHGRHTDARFRAALRLDRLLNDFPQTLGQLREQGFAATADVDHSTKTAVKDFLRSWIDKMNAVYMAVSLPPDFRTDDGSERARLIADCVLPVAEAFRLPFAMMIGVKKRVNPALREAGDSVGKTDIGVVETLAGNYPNVRFLVTMLSRENQHELCVAARKFKNLLPFGCWWFLNNPSIVAEITAERFEMLGLTTIPQHSDARVLDQLIYKWAHSRAVIAEVLARRYFELQRGGWPVSADDMKRDVKRIMGGELLLE